MTNSAPDFPLTLNPFPQRGRGEGEGVETGYAFVKRRIQKGRCAIGMGVSLIIAGGGSGRRFWNKGTRPKHRLSKLFEPLGGKPLLRHTLESFQGIPEVREILLAVAPGTEPWVRKEILRGFSGPPVHLVRGGATRAESVKNALRRASPRLDWVLVHDGARPFPPKAAVLSLLKKRGEAEGVILARPVVPTLKQVAPGNGRVLGTVDRTHLYEAETPQLVRRSTLLKAYRIHPGALAATDEASLLENIGAKVKIFSYSGLNLKVTTSSDLRLAEAEYRNRFSRTGSREPVPAEPVPQNRYGRTGTAEPVRQNRYRRTGTAEPVQQNRYRREPVPAEPVPQNRYGRTGTAEPVPENRFCVGFGRDTHRLVEGRKLYLGGVRIPFEKGALGHSDGDVLLHAASDALLGAIGAGDIGEWFSDRDPRHKNIRSEKILRAVLKEVRRRNHLPSRIDSVILLEKPRLGPYKKLIRRRLALLLGLEAEAVSVKAKTMEGLGPEGEGRAVTAEALVTLIRSPR